MSKILRFPQEQYAPDLPWLLFTSYNADYNLGGSITIRDETKDEIALYMPTSFAVNDTLSYADPRGGWALGIAQSFNNVDDLSDTVRNSLEAAGVLAIRAKTAVAQGLADAVTPGVDLEAVANRAAGRVVNPNSFSIFQSVGLRSFSFSFKFIAQSEKEADAIPEIIKKFRMAAYPDLAQNGIEFLFPKIFKINMINSEQMIKIPYVALENIAVTYNPSSISYFEYKNSPSEVDLTLSFKELRQLTKDQIEEGF